MDCFAGESPKIAAWLLEQGGLETSVSREPFAKENLANIGKIAG
jgi:hypothetical protein